MKNIDFKDEYRDLYRQSADEASLVEVPSFSYLMIDGNGDPNTSEEFSDAVETLYPLAYVIRARVKETEECTFVVMPLEGLWWVEDVAHFDVADKSDWQWTLLLMQPEFVTDELVEHAREVVRENKDVPALSEVRFESYEEGLAAQLLHVGPFAEEGPTVERLHAFIEDQGYERHGKHHEIYLSDMRRTDPEKLKTIIRQPVTE